MSVVVWCCASVVALAGFLKARALPDFRASLAAVIGSSRSARAAGPVVAIELATAVSLLTSMVAGLPDLYSVAVFVLFALALGFASFQLIAILRAGEGCRCFGRLDDGLSVRVGFARAAVVLMLASVILADSRSGAVPDSTLADGITGLLLGLSLLLLIRLVNDLAKFIQFEREMLRKMRKAVLAPGKG